MLVEFRVENFRSFKDEQFLSMVASGSDKTLPGNCTETCKLKLLHGAALYGPNASGKSNLITALDVMQSLVLGSTSSKPGGFMPFYPFLFDATSRHKPSSFEVTFIHKGERYQYGFSATRREIAEEWLYAFPKGRAQKWFRRVSHESAREPLMTWGPTLRGDRTSLWQKTRPDALFLSVAAQWNHEQLTPVYEWFQLFLRVLQAFSTPDVTERALHSASNEQPKKDRLHRYVHSFLQDADLGVSGLDISEVPVDELKFPGEVSAEQRKRILEQIGHPILQTFMLHQVAGTGNTFKLPLQEESDGTRRMFDLAIPWLESLINGYTVVVDEIESSLHPMLVRELIRPYFEPELNKSGAQLVFATHDTRLLDPGLLRRDQVWFTEKDERAATRLYPLSDYKPRKGEALQKGYLSGRYGAVPILRAFHIE